MSRGGSCGGPGRRLAAVTVSLMLLLGAGCASAPPPGQAVPELRNALSQVDRAIVDHRPGQARRQLRRLIHTTVEARDAGRLDSTQADAVLAAAAGLLSTLPRPRPRPEPTPTTPQPEPSTAQPEEGHQGHGHGGEDGHEDEGDGDHGGESDEGE
jgi:hypothetical protein